jgi:hypothetical protein
MFWIEAKFFDSNISWRRFCMSYDFSPEIQASIKVGVSKTFFDKLPKGGAVTISSCLHAIEEAGLSSETSQLRALAGAVRFAPKEYKGRAKEISNMVVRSEIFSILPKEDRKAFLDASSWTRPYNWLMGFLEPGRRFLNRFVRFKKILMSETEQDEVCQAAVQAWQEAAEKAKNPGEVGSIFQTNQGLLISQKKGPRKEMYSTIFSAFSRQIQKTIEEEKKATASRHSIP